MRSTILLLSAALALSACADDQHPSAPSRSPSLARSAAGNNAPRGQGTVVSQAKPTDQVGFTKVFTVNGPTTHRDPGSVGIAVASATCPVGSYPVSGGYSVSLNVDGFRILYNVPTATGWSVTAEAISPFDGMNFNVTVVCVQ